MGSKRVRSGDRTPAPADLEVSAEVVAAGGVDVEAAAGDVYMDVPPSRIPAVDGPVPPTLAERFARDSHPVDGLFDQMYAANGIFNAAFGQGGDVGQRVVAERTSILIFRFRPRSGLEA